MSLASGETVLISGSYDKLIKVWNPKNGKIINELSGHDGGIEYVEKISWNDRKLNTIASSSKDKSLIVWSFTKLYGNYSILYRLTGNNEKINCFTEVFLSSGKKILVSGGEDKKIKLWEFVEK